MLGRPQSPRLVMPARSGFSVNHLSSSPKHLSASPATRQAEAVVERAKQALASPDVQRKDLSWVLSEMRSVEEALDHLDQEDKARRGSLMNARSRALEKYLLAENRLTFQAVLCAWRVQTQREVGRRAIDNCMSRASANDDNCVQRVHTLERELEQLRKEADIAQKEQEHLLQQERAELNAAHMCCEQLEALAEQMGSMSTRIADISQRASEDADAVRLAAIEDQELDDALLATNGHGVTNGHGAHGNGVARATVNHALADKIRALLKVVEDPSISAWEASQLLRVRDSPVNSAEGDEEMLQKAVRAHFFAMDGDGDGFLEWHSGEVRRCVTAAVGGAPAWNDWEWYAIYRSVDINGTHRMDFNSCIALTREVRSKMLKSN